MQDLLISQRRRSLLFTSALQWCPFLDQLSQGCLFHAGHIFKVESMECFKLGKTKYLAVCNLNVVPVISAHENQL